LEDLQNILVLKITNKKQKSSKQEKKHKLAGQVR
jgi:hypothetical protein